MLKLIRLRGMHAEIPAIDECFSVATQKRYPGPRRGATQYCP